MSRGVTRTLRGEDEGENFKNIDRSRQPRFTLQDQDHSVQTSEQNSSKVNSIVSVPLQHPGEEQQHRPDLNTPTEEKVEVIKVYLETRQQKEESRQQSLKMLTDEVSQIQEVRYCLKSLREQMSARQNNNNNKYPANGYTVTVPSNQAIVTNGNIVRTELDAYVGDNQHETLRLREATKRLYTQLKELEKRHQEERDRLQVESNEFRHRLDEQTERLQKTERQSEERGQQVEELQRLLGSMEIESAILKDKMTAGEAELLQLKAGQEQGKEQGKENYQRSEVLEKELAILKEKIHHLDDMLKCQQRKVRHMIEQLQNSRTVIQERDRVIRDLEEKVAFLEAENREMHDHMDYFLGVQNPPPLTSHENKPQVIYSKPLIPSTLRNKSLPFIKVIEIKS
ncbi:tuftelin 1b [Polymixia lowei]